MLPFSCRESISSKFLERINSLKTIKDVSSCLIHSHHPRCRSQAAGSPFAYHEAAHHLLVDVVKIDRSWPYSRASKLSKHLSVHNCLVSYTLIEFQYSLLDATDESKIDLFLKSWIDQIDSFISESIGELEFIISGCELIAGLLKASLKFKPEINKKLWSLLSVTLYKTIQKLDLDSLGEIMDVFRFALESDEGENEIEVYDKNNEDYDEGEVKNWIPFINFIFDLESVPSTVKLYKYII